MGRDRFVKWGARQSRMKKQLRNPYFQNHFHPKRGIRLRGLKSFAVSILIAGGLCALALLPFELLTQPFFEVQAVTYQLDTVIPARQIAIRNVVESVLSQRIFFGHLSNRSYFVLPVKDIDAQVRTTGFYSSVQVKKTFPHTLSIRIQEPDKIFLADDGVSHATLTESGEVVDVYPYNQTSSTNRELPGYIASSSLVIVQVQRPASSTDVFVPGQNGIPNNCATLITSLRRGSKEVGVDPTQFKVNTEGTTVTVDMIGNWQLLTDPIMTAADQLQRLAFVLRNPTYKDTSHVSYIDVRFPDKVYVKTR